MSERVTVTAATSGRLTLSLSSAPSPWVDVSPQCYGLGVTRQPKGAQAPSAGHARPARGRPWLSPAEQDSWQAFMRMQEVLRARLEQSLVAHSGLSAADYAVLAALSQAPDRAMRPVDLGRALGWEKSRLHHQLTRMCNRGLLERRPLPVEGARAVEVTCTPDGLDAISAAAPEHVQDVCRWVIDALTPEQLEQLGAISQAILRTLDDE